LWSTAATSAYCGPRRAAASTSARLALGGGRQRRRHRGVGAVALAAKRRRGGRVGGVDVDWRHRVVALGEHNELARVKVVRKLDHVVQLLARQRLHVEREALDVNDEVRRQLLEAERALASRF
jgi:hypothetical protein